MTTPEDRGPDSTRRVKFDSNNPVHQGIMRTPETNAHIERPSTRAINLHTKVSKDNVGYLTMPVAKGMEEEPKLSSAYFALNKLNSTEAINTSVRKTGKVPSAPVVPKPKPKKKAAIKTDAPSMAETTDTGAKYKGKLKSPAEKAKSKADAEVRQKKIAASLAARRNS